MRDMEGYYAHEENDCDDERVDCDEIDEYNTEDPHDEVCTEGGVEQQDGEYPDQPLDRNASDDVNSRTEKYEEEEDDFGDENQIRKEEKGVRSSKGDKGVRSSKGDNRERTRKGTSNKSIGSIDKSRKSKDLSTSSRSRSTSRYSGSTSEGRDSHERSRRASPSAPSRYRGRGNRQGRPHSDRDYSHRNQSKSHGRRDRNVKISGDTVGRVDLLLEKNRNDSDSFDEKEEVTGGSSGGGFKGKLKEGVEEAHSVGQDILLSAFQVCCAFALRGNEINNFVKEIDHARDEIVNQ